MCSAKSQFWLDAFTHHFTSEYCDDHQKRKFIVPLSMDRKKSLNARVNELHNILLAQQLYVHWVKNTVQSRLGRTRVNWHQTLSKEQQLLVAILK